jgi:periplasmic protein TonB
VFTKILFICLAGLIASSGHAQDSLKSNNAFPKPGGDTVLTEKEKIYTKVDKEASFGGGAAGWKNYLEANFKTNSVARLMRDYVVIDTATHRFTETAYVKFIVCRDGSVCDIEVINKVHPALAAEAKRLIAISPKWIPAEQSRIKVKAYRLQPITMVILE